MKRKQNYVQSANGRWLHYVKNIALSVNGARVTTTSLVHLPNAPQNETMLDDNYLLKTDEVCTYLSINHDQLRKYILQGKIKAIKFSHNVVRIRKAEVDKFLKRYEK